MFKYFCAKCTRKRLEMQKEVLVYVSICAQTFFFSLKAIDWWTDPFSLKICLSWLHRPLFSLLTGRENINILFFFFKKSLTLLIYNGLGLVFSGGQKLLLFVHKFLISTSTRYSGFSPFYSHALCMWLWPNRKHWDLYFIFRRSLPQLAFVLVALLIFCCFTALVRPKQVYTAVLAFS